MIAIASAFPPLPSRCVKRLVRRVGRRRRLAAHACTTGRSKARPLTRRRRGAWLGLAVTDGGRAHTSAHIKTLLYTSRKPTAHNQTNRERRQHPRKKTHHDGLEGGGGPECRACLSRWGAYDTMHQVRRAPESIHMPCIPPTTLHILGMHSTSRWLTDSDMNTPPAANS